ncbi:MAG: radical SAM family heme chaperone HemW [Bacteroidetes bacterium]|nr:radical SAM family heme chaperone HemW [Bacteroidota bacterium]
MAGLYFHIPWCRRVCSYCNFHFSTNTRDMEPLLQAMRKELETEKDFMGTRRLESVYFGGGTPSLLPAEGLDQLLQDVNQWFDVVPGAEITLESNPEDLEPEKMLTWKRSGINRLSIGVQSLGEEDLNHMHRNHTAADSLGAVDRALEAGFSSVNLDLIFGSPWLTDALWEETLDWAFHSGADHISAYALTVEPKTFLNKKIAKGEWPEVNDKRQSEQYRKLYRYAEEHGWDFYEISNLSKPGHRAVHNSNYWKNRPYLGIGPSAHSYIPGLRRWNVSDNRKYTLAWQELQPCFTQEVLENRDMYNEYLLTRIRTTEGVDLPELLAFGLTDAATLEELIGRAESQGLVIRQGTRCTLTLEGRLLADGITADWML